MSSAEPQKPTSEADAVAEPGKAATAPTTQKSLWNKSGPVGPYSLRAMLKLGGQYGVGAIIAGLLLVAALMPDYRRTHPLPSAWWLTVIGLGLATAVMVLTLTAAVVSGWWRYGRKKSPHYVPPAPEASAQTEP